MSESDDPLSSSYMASSIRSSRRRLKTGSAVVLNTDQLQKYIQNSSIENKESMPKSENDQNSVIAKSRKKYEIFDHLRKLKLQFNELPVATENSSSSNSPENYSPFPSLVDQINSVLIIQRKWKQFKNYRFDRFTQFGRWSLSQSNKVFSLLLGYRVRYLLKSIEIILNIKAQRDIIQILSEMCDTSINKLQSNNKSRISGKWNFIEKVIKENNQEYSSDLMTIYTKLTQSDLKLAKSLVKQLLIERQRLYILMFSSSIWMLFPSPGYLDLSMVIQNLMASSKGKVMNDKAHFIFSPLRKLKHSPTKEEELITPPNLRMAMNGAMKTAASPSIQYTHHNNDDNIDSQDNKRPLPLKNVFDMKLGQDSSSIEKSKALSILKTPEISHDSRIASGIKSILSTGSSSKKVIPISSLTPKSMKLRNSNRGHIQLDILSADKLMSAKKGAVSGADRIPCLRVKLMLPTWIYSNNGNKNQFVNNIPQSPESVLKKVHQESRDFTATTLSPQWDTSFILNLPCTRSIILNILSHNAERSYTPNQELSDTTYHIICKSLLQWWSQGTIIIEVFDGERFNTDIFMGQIQLLLSGFLVTIKKYDDLDIKGNFQLCKVKPTDRVSGFVKLHAYLHVPSKCYMNELLNTITSVSSIQSNKNSSNIQFDRLIAKNNLSQDEMINDKSLFEVNENIPNDSIQVNEPPIVYSSKFMKALLSKNKLHQDHHNYSNDVIINDDIIEQPNLEESENIQFNSRTGIVNRNTYSTKQTNNSIIKNIKNENIISITENIKSNQREQSVDSSMMRRYSMVDIAKQLDGLSAVQLSTDEILDNLNLKLKSKGKEQSTKIKNNDLSNNNDLDLSNKSDQKESELKLNPNNSFHKSISSYEDLDYPEMNDDDDDDDVECVVNDSPSSEGNVQDTDHTSSSEEEELVVCHENILEYNDDDIVADEDEEFNHNRKRNDENIKRDNYLIDNQQMKYSKSTIYKNKTIYHSSPSVEVVHNINTANDESSIYSSNIQDMSYFDDNNSSSGINNETTDESDELIVLQRNSCDHILQQSNKDEYNNNEGSYIIQSIHHKIQSQVVSGINNHHVEESIPIKRKNHERFPYESFEDDNNSNIHRVILELNDLEL